MVSARPCLGTRVKKVGEKKLGCLQTELTIIYAHVFTPEISIFYERILFYFFKKYPFESCAEPLTFHFTLS